MGFLIQLLQVVLTPLAVVWAALAVTRRVGNAQLKKDLFEPRYKIFEDVGDFMRPILSSPSKFSTESDEYRKFLDTRQRAEMLFGAETRGYLTDVDATAADLCYAHRKMANDPGDPNAPGKCQEHFDHLTSLFLKRPNIFRRDISVQPIETMEMKAWKPLLYVGSGLIIGLLATKFWPTPTDVHRVSVSYPSRWDAGELRNCRLGKPHYSGYRWPELECDGRGSHGEATQGAHEFVMDVRFAGHYKIPNDAHVETWTCQSSGAGELTCKDWQ